MPDNYLSPKQGRPISAITGLYEPTFEEKNRLLMALAELGRTWGNRLVMDPLENMSKVGGAMLGKNDASLEDVTGAVIDYGMPGVTFGSLQKPSATTLRTFGGKAKSEAGSAGKFGPVDIASQKFKEWFGDSKVVDAEGKPMVVYHSTGNVFDSFDMGKGDIGIHLGTKGQAEERIKDIQKQHKKGREQLKSKQYNVIPAYVTIKNPVYLNDVGNWDFPEFVLDELLVSDVITKLEYDAIQKSTANNRTRLDSIRNLLESKGHDGIIYKNTEEVSFNDFPENFDPDTAEFPESYIVFSPTQIKSAISNTGEFSKTNPSILRGAAAPIPPIGRQREKEYRTKTGGKVKLPDA